MFPFSNFFFLDLLTKLYFYAIIFSYVESVLNRGVFFQLWMLQTNLDSIFFWDFTVVAIITQHFGIILIKYS